MARSSRSSSLELVSRFYKSNSHIRKILEDKSLVELWIKIFPVNFCLVFWFLIRQEIDLDKGIREAGRPVGRWKVAALYHLEGNNCTTQIEWVLIVTVTFNSWVVKSYSSL